MSCMDNYHIARSLEKFLGHFLVKFVVFELQYKKKIHISTLIFRILVFLWKKKKVVSKLFQDVFVTLNLKVLEGVISKVFIYLTA